MAGQLGVSGLFTGMTTRLVMIGTLTAGQCKFRIRLMQKSMDMLTNLYSLDLR